MSIDLDAIEAMISDPYQYAQVSPEVTRGYLAALVAEVERLSRRLGMTRDNAADDLAELRAENERLRAVVRRQERTIEGYESSTRRMDELEGKNERLRAVVEAAEAMLNGLIVDYDTDNTNRQMDDLSAALDAWRAGGEG